MSELLIVAARNETTALALRRGPTIPDLAALLDLGQGPAVERWDQGSVSVLRLRRSPAATVLDVDLPTMQAHFDLLGDLALDVDGPELVVSTGPACWRSLWVAQDADIAFLSTSLRAAAYLLGSFEPDPETPPTFLVTGTLGPIRSWDRRVRQLEPGRTVRLHTGSGRLTETAGAVRDVAPGRRNLTDPEARTALRERIVDTLGNRRPADGEWALPLSGGYDSRGLLLLSPMTMPTITWGAAESARDPRSDSSVAARLAATCGVEHSFLALGDSHIEPDTVLDRFVTASEGRIDHIDGYTDGMALWEGLLARGITGIVRGDEAFGWVGRRTERGVRQSVGAPVASDLVVTEEVGRAGDLSGLWASERRVDESLAGYRDALYRRFRIPSVLAPLNSIKAAFVDVSCPFLAPAVVTQAAALDDSQRTDKRIFRELVRGISPDVPYALRSALPEVRFASRPEAAVALTTRLGRTDQELFPDELLELLRRPAPTVGTAPSRSRSLGRSARRALRDMLPERAVTRIARSQEEGPLPVSHDRMRLRASIALDAVAMLRSCAATGHDRFRDLG